MGTLQVLNEIEATSSRNEKISILRRESGNRRLKRLIKYAMDPYVHYGVRSLPFSTLPVRRGSGYEWSQLFEEFFNLLDKLSNRVLTGNAAREAIVRLFDQLPTIGNKWFSRVLSKNLQIGISAASVNQAWPNHVPMFGVQLANLVKPGKLDFPMFEEPKIDGLRLIARKKSGVVTLMTRRGHLVDTLPEIQEALENGDYDNVVLDGEVQGSNWNDTQSMVSSKVNRVDSSTAVFHVFDAIRVGEWDYGCDEVLTERKKRLNDVVSETRSERVAELPYVRVMSYAEAEKNYYQYILDGYEGAMLKSMSALYEFKRSNSMMKMKPFESSEGTVTGWEYGEGKRANGVGAIIVSMDGVETRVGSGFTDQDLHEMNADPDSVVGRVVEVKYQQKTSDGKLRHPVFLRWRDEE